MELDFYIYLLEISCADVTCGRYGTCGRSARFARFGRFGRFGSRGVGTGAAAAYGRRHDLVLNLYAAGAGAATGFFSASGQSTGSTTYLERAGTALAVLSSTVLRVANPYNEWLTDSKRVRVI